MNAPTEAQLSYVTVLCKILGYYANTSLYVCFVRLDVDLGVLWRLVGCGNPGEIYGVLSHSLNSNRVTFDLPGPRLFVQSFGVSLFEDREGGIDKDFDERQRSLLVKLASEVAVGAVRRNERRDCYAGGIRK